MLLWTGAEDAWGTPDYSNDGSGLGRDGTLWLLDRGVKVIGTDAWGLDRPLGWTCARSSSATATRRRCGPPTASASSASTARSRSCTTSARCRLPTGFTVSCLPVKIAGASAGWCRAVAVVDGP